MYKKIAKNTIYQILSKIIGVGFSLTLTIIITKNLGVYQFGELVKVISFVAIFYTPLDFGINAVILQYFNQKSAPKSHLVSQLNLLRIVAATILLFTLFIIVYFLPGDTQDGYTPLVKQNILILAFTLYIQSIIRTTNSIFQHLLLYKFTLATELIQGTVALISTYIAVNTTQNITPITLGYLVGGSVAALVQYLFATKLIPIKLTTLDHSFIKKLIIKSLPLGLVIIISALHTKTDILLLTNLRSTTEVGVFGLVKRIFEAVLTIPLFFSNSLYPILLKNSHKNIVKQSVFTMFLSSIVISAFLIFTSSLLVLIKPEFKAAIPLLRSISLILPLFFITAPLMWKMISLGQQTKLIWIYLQAFIINAIFSFTLIPTLGAQATIIGLALSEASILFCLIYFTSKSYEHKQ